MEKYSLKTLIILFCSFLVIVVAITCLTSNYNEDFFNNLLIEAHGAILDVFVFGILLHVVSMKLMRQQSIRDAHDIFTGLQHQRNLTENSKEILKKSLHLIYSKNNKLENLVFSHDLEEMNLSSIYFKNCSFRKGSLLSGVDFSNTKFDSCDFTGDLFDSRKNETKFENTIFTSCNFTQMIDNNLTAQWFSKSRFGSKCKFIGELSDLVINKNLIDGTLE